MGDKPLVGLGNALAEFCLVSPAKLVQAGDIQQLAGRAVRLGSVEL